MSTFEFCGDCIEKGNAMLKDYDEQIIEKIKKYKEDFRKQVKGIPPELNKEKTLNQVDSIMWGLMDKHFGDNSI